MDFRMKTFFYEVVVRLVAIYLCFDCGRKLWYGFAEKKILFFGSLSVWLVHKDASPFLYWSAVCSQIFSLVACALVAIFGWWPPDGAVGAVIVTAPDS
jgi:hypothetical protein